MVRSINDIKTPENILLPIKERFDHWQILYPLCRRDYPVECAVHKVSTIPPDKARAAFMHEDDQLMVSAR